jgi:hypothetical protein
MNNEEQKPNIGVEAALAIDLSVTIKRVGLGQYLFKVVVAQGPEGKTLNDEKICSTLIEASERLDIVTHIRIDSANQKVTARLNVTGTHKDSHEKQSVDETETFDHPIPALVWVMSKQASLLRQLSNGEECDCPNCTKERAEKVKPEIKLGDEPKA